MFKTIERPTNRDIQSVICFLKARNVKTADIHYQICEVYSENAMSDGMRKWVRKFNEGRDNMHDELQNGWPSVFTGSHVLHEEDTETDVIMINALIMVKTM